MKKITQVVLYIFFVFLTFNIYGQGTLEVTGIGVIANGDMVPSIADDTDFGSIIVGSSNTNTFGLDNTVGGNSSKYINNVTVSITGSTDFTPNSTLIGQIKGADGIIPHIITFTPSSGGLKTATVTITFTNGTNSPYTFAIQGTGVVPQPEINITGLGTSIPNGDVTPLTTDDTDYGIVGTSSTTTHTFTIENTGNPASNLTISDLGTGITITGGSAYFAINTEPAQNSTISGGSSLNFSIDYNPLTVGTHTATVTIDNDDSDEDPYTFTITGEAVIPAPEIDVEGNSTSIVGDGMNTPSILDYTDFGSVNEAGGTKTYTFTIKNTGTLALNLTASSPYVTISGTHAADFTLTANPTTPISAGSTTTFNITFDPSALGVRTAIITIANDDSDENPYTFNIQGTGDIIKAPGGVDADLTLWLKGNAGLSYSNGQSVTTWEDQTSNGYDATAPVVGVEPTYRDNPTYNVNFNPVVDFDNDYSSVSLDSDYSFDNTATDFLQGSAGYYSQDVFVVLIPDTTVNPSFGSMDVFCGDEDITKNETDATGIGLGAYSVRFSGEIISYAHGTTSSGNGYGVAEIGTGNTYNNTGIINARNNTGATQQELYYNATDIETTQNDVPDFANVNNSRYWIGRSEGWEASTDARIAEIITYSSRKSDTDLTQERNRIQSYLAIKYGITLGVNGTSQDYVDSNGDVIWDVNTGTPAEDVFNYDIAGIGRDDTSGLYQKQSRSVNNALDGATRGQGILTMGISSVYDTNNLNPNTLNDKEFLIWGNDGVDLDDPSVDVDVDMSTLITPAISGGTPVEFHGIARTWKVVEKANGGDIPSVEVAILTSAVRTAAPPYGSYLMFISDTPNFDPTADYRVMTESTNELGESIVKTNYDFDNTKYITFGWAPEKVYERSIYFGGTTDYIDMEDALDLNPTEFTISSWINRESGSNNTSILSKRDYSYTEGYDFKINNSGNFEVSWENGSSQTITSNTIIPEDQWHHVAIIYSGGTASLYIDGVLDNSASLSAPLATSQSFNIAAAGKGTLGAFFKGNIDEVRVWNSALTVDQLRFVMNQEIEDNSNFANGSYLVNRSAIPTKNDIMTVPWSNLAGYYPMSTYTYTNTKDESGNGNQGALRNLRTVDRQTAPLPYISVQDGDWNTGTTWVNGDMQVIPGSASIVDNTITVDWNLVKTAHNITIDNSSLPVGNNKNRSVLGLFVDSNEITVQGDNILGTGNGLTVTHYLKLNGNIDLEGESQLIQTLGSDLDVTSAGAIEKDQQGTKDLYTYNYWSSPVGTKNILSNNTSITLNTTDFFKDGTNPASPANITFITNSYDGTSGAGIGIADYWIWKYADNITNTYSQWEHVRSSGAIDAGEGFTMKGVANTGDAITQTQNYVFNGKPNNGDISLSIAPNNDYLVGNPYPSALDADEFLKDNLGITDGGRNTNGNIINGVLYFWDHFASSTHILREYEGGYATYTLMGGAPAVSTDSRIKATSETGTKIPERYIPVGQGFLVSAILDTDMISDPNDPDIDDPIIGGSIVFKNSQRAFTTEASGNSAFLRTSGKNVKSSATKTNADTRQKIRLMFDSPTGYHRQLLAGVDSNTSSGFDPGYDALLNETNKEDMFWVFDNSNFVIQAVNNFDTDQKLSLGLKIFQEGLATIKIDDLENITSDVNIFIHDKELDIYHDLRQSNYEVYLTPNTYLERFAITFSSAQSLGTDTFETSTLQTYYSNVRRSLILHNPFLEDIESVEMFNILGQSIFGTRNIEKENYQEFKTKQISSGTYIIKVNTQKGAFSKKVLIK